MEIPKGETCEICGMVATHAVQDENGKVHYYDDHHLPSSGSNPLEYSSEIKTKSKDYVLFAVIILFIFASAYLYQYFFGHSGIKEYMRAFMGMFFLTFSAFKLVDLKGFMMSYVGYDVIARRWFNYGYIYPFIELTLGLAFLLNFRVTTAYIIDVVVMGISSIGVISQLLKGSKIRCACLGSFIKLPLTTVSLVEDGTMLAMGLISIFI